MYLINQMTPKHSDTSWWKNKPGISVHSVSGFYKLNQEPVSLSFSFISFPSVVKRWLTRADYTADKNNHEKQDEWWEMGVNSTHLNTAEISPFIAPVQESSPKYVSELTGRKPRS